LAIECYFDICPYHSAYGIKEEDIEGPLCYEDECHVPKELAVSFGIICTRIDKFKKEIDERNKQYECNNIL
jgi:hypothetical protein